MRLLFNVKKKKKGTDKKYDPKNEFFSYSAYLNEKKRLMSFYNNSFSTKWLKRYIEQAHKYIGQKLANILYLVERRLDVALYRIRFCRSVSEARQMIVHRKVLVNGVLVLQPSYQLKPGDIVKIEKWKNSSSLSTDFTLIKRLKTQKTLDPITYKRRRQQMLRNKLKHQESFKKKKKPLFLIFKPLHVEINYALKTAIFLYSPQVLYFPDKIRLDFIRRRFRV